MRKRTSRILHLVMSFTAIFTASSGVSVTFADTPLSIRVAGNQFVDGQGHKVELRGVNVSGLEGTAIQGWAWVDPSKTRFDPWADAHLGTLGIDDYPDWSVIKTWKSNVVRLPLNEACWLGLTTYDNNGKSRNADPGGNYRAVVEKSVAQAVAAGLIVILDLHWAAPNVVVPGKPSPVPSTPIDSQNPMANADHSVAFWTSVARTFKNNPAVMYELFNEPYFQDSLTLLEDPWDVWLNGGTVTKYVADGATISYRWQTAGMQRMLDAVRLTGATNVVLIGGVLYASDLSGWLAHRPVDPINQLAAVWHAYQKSSVAGSPDSRIPASGNIQYTYIENIMSANVPVIITEIGDHSAAGTVDAPFASTVLPWADAHGISYLGWGWDPWGGADNDLIKDASGNPTDGYGRYFRQHLLCVANHGIECP
jgi:endoglucanase